MAKVFQVPPRDFDPSRIAEAAQILANGGIVAFPTETVYGLGASCRQPGAVSRLAELKGRPADKPFSYHLARAEEARDIVPAIPAIGLRLIERYWPGPLTLVVPAGDASGRHTVGLRVPANEIARRLIEMTGTPLLVPSANPQGEPPAICAEDVVRYFDGRIDAVVDGGPCQIKQASTVVRVDDKGFEVLREGIITREMIHQLVDGRHILFVCTGNTCRSPMAAAFFRKHLAAKLGKSPDDLGELGYKIISAGTFASYGNGPSEHAVSALKELGCDLLDHRSQPVTADLLAEADRIYALGHSHQQLLLQMDPTVELRLAMISGSGITDPVGGDLETYRKCAREIEREILRLLEHWG